MHNKMCNNCCRVYDGDLEMCPFCGYEDGDPAAEAYFLCPGMMLNNRYIVGEVLGFGGFGIIYKAWDNNLNIIVAIKEYYYAGVATRQPGTQPVLIYTQNRRAEYQHFLYRFLDEARYTAKFGSENSSIVNVYEFFEANNTAYMVMEFLEGITLNEYLKKDTMDVEQCITVMQNICSALKTVHAGGIIHRDISPDNIMLCTDRTLTLFDFGAARFSKNEDPEMTKRTQVMKPGFSPPEQYQSISKQGPWTDVYALGATLYYMITGVKPLESTNRIEEGKDSLIPPKEIRPDIPDYINDTIFRAMALEMHLRFSSVDEFEKALYREKPVLSITKEKKRRRKNRVLGLISAVLALVIGFSAFAYFYNRQRTLPDCEIEFWYILPETAELAEAKNNSLATIINGFLDGYPDTKAKIILRPFQEDEYIKSINDAYRDNALPPLFESAGMDRSIIEAAHSAEGAVKSTDLSSTLFFDTYKKTFPEAKQFPIGFIMPCKYTLKYEIDPDDYNALDEIEKKELFLSGRISEYLGSTADYFEVQQNLEANYIVYMIDNEEIVCTFSELLSIGNCKNDQLTVVNRFLVYFLGETAQDCYHIQYHSGSLPLNKTALTENFVAIYSDFDGFFDNIDQYPIKRP